jgi:AcrR family transcriptional regulator
VSPSTATKPRRKPRRTQAERTETTTRHLRATARELFAREGYSATSLDAIVEACGVTKGAFYHHFKSKEEIFEAVFVEEQRQIATAIVASYQTERDPIEASFTACRAFFDVSLDPGVQRITLLDAPAVLGWDRMREIRSQFGLRLMKESIRAAIEAKRMRRRDVDALAHLLFGALCEGAMYMARAEDQRGARRKVEREYQTLLGALST